MDLSRTVSEINGDFSWKSPNFPTPVYLRPRCTGLPLQLGIGARSQKSEKIGLPGDRKSFKIGLAV